MYSAKVSSAKLHARQLASVGRVPFVFYKSSPLHFQAKIITSTLNHILL